MNSDQNPYIGQDQQSQQPRAPQGRVPPHDLEIERSVLGAVLVNNEAIHHVNDTGLHPEHFYRDSHRKIFEVIQALSDKQDPLDLLTLTSALRDRGWYDSVGGLAALTSLFEDQFATGNVAAYARRIREKAVLRRMIEATSEIASQAYEPVEDVESFMEDSERKVFSVMDVRLTKTFSNVQEVLGVAIRQIEELANNQNPIPGLATGFNEFDKMTTGLKGGQLIIVAARPGMGKTSYMLSLVQNAAIMSKSVVAVFSLEMTKTELLLRLLSGAAKIPAKRLKLGRLQDRDWQKLAHGADLLSKSRIFMDDSGDLTVYDMRARCRRLKLTEKKLDLIVVDYLQLMRGAKSGGGKTESREREISEISRNLKALAKELKCPIIALSQLNRRVEQGNQKRPMLSDLRESGAIEQDADIVCFIYRDEVYNENSEEKGIAELIVAKHREGETGTVKMAWLAECTLFANLAGDQPGTPVINRPAPRPNLGIDPDISL